MKTLAADLKRAKWLDDEATDLGLHRHPELGLANAEIITALCSMLHGPLFKLDPQAYPSIRSIVQILDSNVKYIRRAKSIALLFLDKFHPVTGAQFNENEYEKRAQDILQSIGTLQNDAAVQILTRMVDAVGATMRTNFYNENRYALSMRVNPIIMATGEIGKEKPLPFGVFFCHGRLFNAFHCRFRDIARGKSDLSHLLFMLNGMTLQVD